MVENISPVFFVCKHLSSRSSFCCLYDNLFRLYISCSCWAHFFSSFLPLFGLSISTWVFGASNASESFESFFRLPPSQLTPLFFPVDKFRLHLLAQGIHRSQGGMTLPRKCKDRGRMRRGQTRKRRGPHVTGLSSSPDDSGSRRGREVQGVCALRTWRTLFLPVPLHPSESPRPSSYQLD